MTKKPLIVAMILATQLTSPTSSAARQVGCDVDKPMDDVVWRDAQKAFVERGDRSVTRCFLDRLRKENAKGRGSFYLGILLRDYARYGLGRKELDAFFAPLKKNQDADIARQYRAWTNFVKLRTTPFEFVGRTMEGKPFNLADLRGKIVLIKYWNTGCASCIEAMPRIDAIYRKYKDKGFEVVSVLHEDDGILERKRAARIVKENGLTWPEVDGARQWKDIKLKYGYLATGEYMLLNRDHTLYAGTGEVRNGHNLEPLLKKMLAREAVRRGS